MMVASPKKFTLLYDMNMPIRDALRGVVSLADATEDMLEPASKLLPEPLRSRFHARFGEDRIQHREQSDVQATEVSIPENAQHHF